MERYLLFFFSITILFLSSCKKNEVEPETTVVKSYHQEKSSLCGETIDVSTHETIITNSYLAAYPGAWWEYSDGSMITCELDSFPLINSKKMGDDCRYKELNMTFVSHLKKDGYSFAYVYDNSYIKDRAMFDFCDYSYHETHFYTQIQEEVGSEWAVDPDDCCYKSCEHVDRETIEHFDSYVLPNGDVYNDVLHIRETIYQPKEIDGCWEVINEYYYANEIGMIYRIKSAWDSPFYDTTWVINYDIP